MRRFSKVLVFVAACVAALILTVRHGGDGIRVGGDAHLRAATRTPSKYDLSLTPIFIKTLYFVRENYFDKNRLDPKRMLVGALDFIQRVAEALDVSVAELLGSQPEAARGKPGPPPQLQLASNRSDVSPAKNRSSLSVSSILF